jgi:GT2 family glycosyltransferase
MAKVKLAQPRVSIIILNWNGLEDTVECLESLKKITYPDYEVIVVDNGSEGNDVQVLKKRFADYIYLIENDRNYGFAVGANIGIRYALNNSHPDYFLLLNNDTVVAPDFLNEMVKVVESDSLIGIAGCKNYLYSHPQRFWLAWVRINLWKGQTPWVGADELDQGQYDNVNEVVCVPASCCLIKRDLIEKLGTFDESYITYWEDIDYCVRAKKLGFKIAFVAKAKIWHKVGRTGEKVPELHRYYSAKNMFKFMKKHAAKIQYCCFLLYFFGLRFWFTIAVLLIYHRELKGLQYFLKGVKDGLFV